MKRRLERCPRLWSFMHLSCLSPFVWRPIAKWRREGKPLPPPNAFKRRLIRDRAKEHGIRVLVETGTYMGDTVATLLHKFDEIHSIEVNPSFYERASSRFEDIAKVSLTLGDSRVELPPLVARLDSAALFFLDGHLEFSAAEISHDASPVLQELACILVSDVKGHIVLIDDARCFGVAYSGYPTIEEVTDLVAQRRPDLRVTVADDIIQILPKR